MRLNRNDLFKITHLHRPKGQAAWFLEYLGVKVPCDSVGPILTPSTYEAILAKKLGVFPSGGCETVAREVVIHVPTPRPVKQRLASVNEIKGKP